MTQPDHLRMTHAFMRDLAKQEKECGAENATVRFILQDWLKENNFWNGTACMYCVARWPCLLSPRLNFADWREELGDPDWAEFIRLQVQTYHWPKEYMYGPLESFVLGQRFYSAGHRGSHRHPIDGEKIRTHGRLYELLRSQQPTNEFMSDQPMTYTRVSAAFAWSCCTRYLCGSVDIVFRGGFPEQVVTHDYNWGRHGAYVVSRCPLKEVLFAFTANDFYNFHWGPYGSRGSLQEGAADEARKLAWPTERYGWDDHEEEISL